MKSFLKLAASVAMIGVLTGCAGVTSNVYNNASSQVSPMSPTMVFMPADIEINIQKAGGDLELDVELSDESREGYETAVNEFMFERGVRVVPYEAESTVDAHLDLVREANTVMDSIELSQSASGGIGSSRNLSLSESARSSLAGFGADYVTFTVLRATTPSGGRQAVAVLAAIGGVAVQTADAKFRVAVFDLRDGQCIWANFDPLALPDGKWLKADEDEWLKNIEHMYQEFPL